MRRQVSLILFSTFLAGPALAQQAPQQPTPAAPAQQQMQQQPGQASGPLNFKQQQQQNEWSAQWLSGSNVYNRQNENLGTINDIILGSDGQVTAVVIGVGGFLGIGEKNVGVDFRAIDIQPIAATTTTTTTTTTAPAPQARQQGTTAPTTGQAVPMQQPATQAGQTGAPATTTGNTNDRRVYLDATRDQLNAAPEFTHLDAQRGTFGGAGSAR